MRGRDLVAALLGALAAALPASAPAAEPGAASLDRFPRAGASYVVMRDGALLWARRPDAPRAPASLAKLMTALVAVEAGWDPGAWIPVGRAAARETGARLGLREGDALRASDALAATLVASANDACRALAERVGGGVRPFVARMNARAVEMGLTGTRFEDPCGHDRAGQRTTASDLVQLSRAVLADSRLRPLVAQERVALTTRGGRSLEAATRNSLLGRARGVAGVKTGTTDAAGRCVVAFAQREGVEVLVVLLGAPDRWFTAAALLDAAFAEAPRGD